MTDIGVACSPDLIALGSQKGQVSVKQIRQHQEWELLPKVDEKNGHLKQGFPLYPVEIETQKVSDAPISIVEFSQNNNPCDYFTASESRIFSRKSQKIVSLPGDIKLLKVLNLPDKKQGFEPLLAV